MKVLTREQIRARIMARVRIDPDTGCYIWQGPTSGDNGRGRGYPRMWLRGQMCATHRVMFINEYGHVPAKAQIDHKCRNRLCVNPHPDHLELVSHHENCRRRDEAQEETE